MRTELVYFGTSDDSRKGTIRGTVAAVCILILSWLWYGVLMKSTYAKYRETTSSVNRYAGMAVAILVLCSAIAVQLPSSPTVAIVYGALVGFVVYGFCNSVGLMINERWTLSLSFVDTAWGVASTALISWILYEIFFKGRKY